jgi:hypothetical protein
MAKFVLQWLSIGVLGMSLAACASMRSPSTTTQQPTASQTTPAGTTPSSAPAGQNTFDRETVMKEATGFFGKGAEGVGKVVEKLFSELGQPNGYIVGEEVGGAFIGGLRYGDGTLFHKVEGQQKVHWTGPSIGFDVGGDASKTFTLIYNLNDTQDMFQRFPAVEGKVYFIGGFSVNYHQRGNVILAPIRLGAGWRLGVNIGYLNYTKERTYIPF